MSPVSLEGWAQDDWGLGLCSSVTACALPRDCSVVQLVPSFHATGCPRVVYVSEHGKLTSSRGFEWSPFLGCLVPLSTGGQ